MGTRSADAGPPSTSDSAMLVAADPRSSLRESENAKGAAPAPAGNKPPTIITRARAVLMNNGRLALRADSDLVNISVSLFRADGFATRPARFALLDGCFLFFLRSLTEKPLNSRLRARQTIDMPKRNVVRCLSHGCILVEHPFQQVDHPAGGLQSTGRLFFVHTWALPGVPWSLCSGARLRSS